MAPENTQGWKRFNDSSLPDLRYTLYMRLVISDYGLVINDSWLVSGSSGSNS